MKNLAQTDEFEKFLKPPAEKGTIQYTQWLSKLWRATAKLNKPDVRRLFSPCWAHLEVIYHHVKVNKFISSYKVYNIFILVVKKLAQADEFEKLLKPPAEKGSAQYTQWLSKLWKETAKLRNQDVRRFLNPCRAHLEVL